MLHDDPALLKTGKDKLIEELRAKGQTINKEKKTLWP